MRLVDVVLHTSTAPEPFGRVVVEGMLARRPVVATRQGGVLEIVEDGVTGRLVPPGNAAALAHTLKDLLATPDAAARLAANGYARARATFSVASMLEGLRDAVDATLADRR
jgi:glycosyltransferase involved in cell wall biosynthesis